MLTLRRSLLIAGVVTGFAATAQKNFQPGYIVRSQHDTVRGQIDYREWVASPRTVTFQDGSGVRTEFQTGEISAFFVNGETYRSFRVHVIPYVTLGDGNAVPPPYDTTAFLRLITQGKLNLYLLNEEDKDHFFIQQGSGSPLQLEITTVEVNHDGAMGLERRDEYQYQLARWIADCPGMAKSKIEVDYTEKALRKLIIAYNHCGGQTPVEDIAEKKDTSRRVFFTPVIGFMHSTVGVSGNSSVEAGEQWPACNTFTGGVGMLLVLPRLRGQFAFVINALYQHFSSAGSPSNGGYGAEVHGHFDFDQAQLDLLFRYRIPTLSKVRPFINGGVGEISIFNNKSIRYIDGITNPQPLFGDASYMHKWQLGVIGGIGVEISRFTLEARIERTDNFSNINGTVANMTHLGLLAGFNF